MYSASQQAIPRRPHPECVLSRALDAALSPDFVDDFDWEYVSPDGLRICDAFALATQWSTRLQRHIGCSGAIANELEVVPNQQWIDIKLGDSTVDGVSTATMARAPVLLWQALVTCRGYGINENEGFWRRVFDHLHRAPVGKVKGAVPYEFVGHNVRFFDGVAFPRCRVAIKDVSTYDVTTDRNLRAFAGLDPDGTVMEELREALSVLAPYARMDQCTAVDVMIMFTSQTGQASVTTLLDTISTIELAHKTHAVLGNDSSSGASILKRLLLQPWSIQVHLPESLYVLAVTRNRAFPLHGCAAIPAFSSDGPGRQFESLSDRLKYAEYVRWLLGLSRLGGGAQAVDFKYPDQPDCLAGLCAGLPFATSVKRVDIHSPFRTSSVSNTNLAWLAFALFHPESAASTWKELKISRIEHRQSAQWSSDGVIELMAMGNNLRVIMGLTTETTDRYYTAHLQVGAVIYARANDSSNGSRPSGIVMTVDKVMSMDVCVMTVDIKALEQWVMAVVPGFGIAYVESACIESITAREPGRAFLKRMKLEWLDFGWTGPTMLIQLIGGELEYLDYTKGHDQEERVEVIPAACPKLVSYRLSEHYRPFSHLSERPRATLRELVLTVASEEELRSKLTMLQSLTRLETLVIDTDISNMPMDAEGFVLPLLRSLPQLRRFHWLASYSSTTLRKTTYAQRRSISRKTIPGLVSGRDDVALLPTLIADIVALISVVESYAKAATVYPLGQLSREEVTLISSFVGHVVERDLYVVLRRRWIYEATGSEY